MHQLAAVYLSECGVSTVWGFLQLHKFEMVAMAGTLDLAGTLQGPFWRVRRRAWHSLIDGGASKNVSLLFPSSSHSPLSLRSLAPRLPPTFRQVKAIRAGLRAEAPFVEHSQMEAGTDGEAVSPGRDAGEEEGDGAGSLSRRLKSAVSHATQSSPGGSHCRHKQAGRDTPGSMGGEECGAALGFPVGGVTAGKEALREEACAVEVDTIDRFQVRGALWGP